MWLPGKWGEGHHKHEAEVVDKEDQAHGHHPQPGHRSRGHNRGGGASGVALWKSGLVKGGGWACLCSFVPENINVPLPSKQLQWKSLTKV